MNEQRVHEAIFRVEAMGTDITEIKSAVKELAAAVGRLAVIEERQAQDRAEISRVFKRLDGHDARLGALELAQPLQKQTTDWVQKAIWLVIGSVITAVLSLVIVNRSTEIRKAEVPQLTMPAK